MDNQYHLFRSITLKQLTYALAAAEESSVSGAARKLNVSQPAISAAIAVLESHYGLKLFIRQPAQGIALTPFGMKVMAEARLLCDQANKVASLATPGTEVTGEVTLCCYGTIAPYILPRILMRLKDRLPDVTVRFSETSLEGAAQSLRQGTADLAISYDLGLQRDVVTDTLFTLQPEAICSATHRFAGHKTVRLSDFRDEPLILLDQPMSAQYVMGLLQAKGVHAIVAAQVQGFELQRALVANDFGVAIVHSSPRTSTAYDGKPVCSIAIADDLAEQRVLLACLEQNLGRPLLAAVRHEVTAAFQSGAAA
ncbi:MAG: LysR substrate-binding domain-containing protein [Alphaproteobacteria bacterium]